MPAPLLRPCAAPGGCPELVPPGTPYCLEHQSYARVREQERGSPTRRGYGVRWRAFRIWVRNRMIALGIVPVCGATLPGGPVTQDSLCQQQRRLVGQNSDGSELHLDHEPSLRFEERGDARAVCDPLRVQWLCRECHARKTQREQARP